MTPLLTVTELRQHVETDLGDAALQRILDGETQAIEARIGPVTTVTEHYSGGTGVGSLLLYQPAATIQAITERRGAVATVLDPADYHLHLVGLAVWRRTSGPNPASWWGDLVTVTYTPVSQGAERTGILIQLCKLALRYEGVISETAGSYSWSAAPDYVEERERLIASLRRTGMVFA